MTNTLFQVTAKDWVHWGNQSTKFVKKYVENETNNLDEPFLRSCYILLAYAFELMVKSRLVKVGNITEEQLKIEYSHNIKKILEKLESLDDLKNIGIKSFREDGGKHVYVIKNTNDKEITIDDFTNIRYRPKSGDYANSHKTILDTTMVMLEISTKILSD